MSATYVIGDIHGAYKALQQVMDKAPVKEGDTLIFMGDYVDGWSQSFEVIAYLMQLKERFRCIFIRGNHDDWTQRWLIDNESDPVWLAHGGEETRLSYKGRTAEDMAAHKRFFEALQFFFIDVQNRLFVHGGFTSKKGPSGEANPYILLIDRTLWETAVATNPALSTSSLFYPKRLNIFKEIFIGHTPTLYLDTDKPITACNVTNVDTGAAFTGRLTIMDIDTKEYWQSDIVKTLYPGERGRNKW